MEMPIVDLINIKSFWMNPFNLPLFELTAEKRLADFSQAQCVDKVILAAKPPQGSLVQRYRGRCYEVAYGLLIHSGAGSEAD